MFGQDRNQIRQFFFTVWQKQQNREAMEPLEQIVATVMNEHPEYHYLFSDPANHLDRDWTPEQGETNPFLHMGMHISLQEQLSTDRPAGIRQLYQEIRNKTGDTHQTEHKMMDCLGYVLWQAQSEKREPDQQAFLDCLAKLL